MNFGPDLNKLKFKTITATITPKRHASQRNKVQQSQLSEYILPSLKRKGNISAAFRSRLGFEFIAIDYNQC